ncbi:hypothetical protein BLOT_002860 [Blomia tropicalis]|nr:hypothetical protein BLOT_002860 [Blomia tropicalis]
MYMHWKVGWVIVNGHHLSINIKHTGKETVNYKVVERHFDDQCRTTIFGRLTTCSEELSSAQLFDTAHELRTVSRTSQNLHDY